MQINIGSKRIDLQGDRVFVNGKEVPLDEGSGPSSVQESEVSKQARSALESRYPNVKFIGDCSKITVDDSVKIEGAVTIEQTDAAEIRIAGTSHIGEGVHISTPRSCVASLNSVSFSGGCISVVSVGARDQSGSQGIQIYDTAIGQHAEVRGLSLSLKKSQILEKSQIACDGSGTIDIEECEIGASVHCAGSGDITIEGSKIFASLDVRGSGDIDIKNASIVRGPISILGSGDVTVSGSTITEGGSLAVMGSGDIIAKKCTVSRPHAVHGSDDIRI